jgi:hypothetical protein
MVGINLLFVVWMIVVLSFQVLRAFLVRILKMKHEDIYMALGRPGPIGRDVFFVFDINKRNGYELLSKKEKLLVMFMKVLACTGGLMIIIFMCVLVR